MKQDFFKKLPSEIITNILSRLPIPTIARSKCVGKQWLHLLKTDEFANSHLASSVPGLGLAVLTQKTDSTSCAIFEFQDEQDLDHHDLHYNLLTKFDFPHKVEIKGSASGLLFLNGGEYEAHYVCNPITHEYVELRFPIELVRPCPYKVINYPEILGESLYSYPQSITYGFGASKISGQYKVVRIFHDSVIAPQLHGGRGRTIPQSECHVQTLGTGLWRRVEPGGALLEYPARTSCVFLNGNLHWVVSDSDSNLWISCFDLETECFSSFSAPRVHQGSFEIIGALSILDHCLCFCDHTREDVTVIWLMKEYGVEKSWTKEYVISINEDLDIEGFELVYPLKVFKDGDILMLREDCQLFYYSTRTRTAQDIGMFGEGFVSSILFSPSFLSLKSLGMENVMSL